MALTKISGSIIKDSVSLSGNVSIGGTLTYQDVTNVDALGIGTFRTGIKVLAGQIDVGSNIKLGNAGVVTATSFVGSGANLTNLNASNIASGTVPTARLGSGTASSSTFLRGDSTFQTVNTDLVSDTSPQLGGNLDTNSHEISLDTSHAINFGDSNELRVFYHSGNGQIDFNGTTSLQLKTPANKYFQVVNRDNGNNIIQAQAGGDVQLYHNGTRKFRTTSGGVRTDANLEMLDNHELQLGNNVDLKIFHESSSNDNIIDCATTRPLRIRFGGSNQFEFLSGGGIKINDSRKIFLGDSSDFEIFHDGLDSFIKDTGTGALKVCSNLFRVNNAANTEAMIKAEENAGVTLSYDANTKFETTSSGVTVTGTCSATAFSGSSGTLTGVAFAAVRTAGNSNNTPFVFNSEEFDIGGDYNASNGIFTAPDIGYYQITVQMTSTSYSGNRHFYLDSSTNGGGSWTERANALTGTPGGANESINMFIGGIFKTTVTNQQFRVRTGYEFRGTSTYARFSAFKI